MTAPREGIYLDAALQVIGQHVDERIDELLRRRRLRVRIGICALAMLTLATGSVAAVALTSSVPDALVSAPTARVDGELRCVEGVDASAPAYFSVRYSGQIEVDPVDWCSAAWAALDADPEGVSAASPDRLIALAAELASSHVQSAIDETQVREATFGLITTGGGFGLPAMAACTRPDDPRVTVISVARGSEPTDPASWAKRCAAEDSRVAGAP
ncbi:MAG TPA: hypothetical protein VNT50_04345 [Microbacterium sp.]|uniref:hypothetical protein n=1 Tax=Microbacterium sp. TaxID=51671 RepID=UPI002BAD648E|nr:hypothetical protein [Microbacterium sp.]HWI30696.1 hypothetical protein [Microbacterium sp.]